MQTRPHDFLDTRTLAPRYSFQVRDGGQWKNAAENGKPCLFDTKAERDAKRAEFRKLPCAG